MNKNTFYEFTFFDGTKTKMTLTFYALYQLKGTNRVLYDRYNKIMTKGVSDELDMITVLYAAYVCAEILEKTGKELMSEEDFLINCGYDRIAIKEAIEGLIQPKKQ